jgi:hypothetical protein
MIYVAECIWDFEQVEYHLASTLEKALEGARGLEWIDEEGHRLTGDTVAVYEIPLDLPTKNGSYLEHGKEVWRDSGRKPIEVKPATFTFTVAELNSKSPFKERL